MYIDPLKLTLMNQISYIQFLEKQHKIYNSNKNHAITARAPRPIYSTSEINYEEANGLDPFLYHFLVLFSMPKPINIMPLNAPSYNS